MKLLFICLLVALFGSSSFARSNDALNKALNQSYDEKAIVQKSFRSTVKSRRDHDKKANEHQQKAIAIEVGDELGTSSAGGREEGLDFHSDGEDAKVGLIDIDHKEDLRDMDKTLKNSYKDISADSDRANKASARKN